jgi:hypothetical protein
VPALRTEITEIVTGLGMLGAPDVDEALSSRPSQLVHVDDDTWRRLHEARASREHDLDFLAAWNNGRAFLTSDEALRGRPPALVEWKGGHRDPGDHAVPSDLRVDHVYLVSCKYLSNVLHNASPWALFDQHLLGGGGRRAEGDWFDTVAPREHQELYRLVRQRHGADLALPEATSSLTKDQRRALRQRIPRDWDRSCAEAYGELCRVASEESARRWASGLGSTRDQAAMLWRLLRLSAAPYFVLGTSAAGSLRLRVDTPWDFSRRHRLRRLAIEAGTGGQPTVSWRASVLGLDDGEEVDVRGHVEVRWSHGRFGGPPEAKVYLDTPHRRVPGYVALG